MVFVKKATEKRQGTALPGKHEQMPGNLEDIHS